MTDQKCAIAMSSAKQRIDGEAEVFVLLSRCVVADVFSVSEGEIADETKHTITNHRRVLSDNKADIAQYVVTW